MTHSFPTTLSSYRRVKHGVLDLEQMLASRRLPQLSRYVQSTAQIALLLADRTIVKADTSLDQVVKLGEELRDDPLGQRRRERLYACRTDRKSTRLNSSH